VPQNVFNISCSNLFLSFKRLPANSDAIVSRWARSVRQATLRSQAFVERQSDVEVQRIEGHRLQHGRSLIRDPPPLPPFPVFLAEWGLPGLCCPTDLPDQEAGAWQDSLAEGRQMHIWHIDVTAVGRIAK
jgi:hypothetical protein